MARIDLNADTLPAFIARVERLVPDAAPGWGTMSPAHMLAHLRITFEVSLEERAAHDESWPGLTGILYVLLFRVFTEWPRGRIKATAQFLDDGAADFESERERLVDAMGRFVSEAAREPGRVTLEPMLGRISMQQWQRVHGVHCDYHLRQFGVY